MSRRTETAPKPRSADPMAFIETFVEMVADRVAQKLGGEGSGWIDQSASPLGPRRHRKAVCERMASGRPGATRIGRKHLLTREALAEELSERGNKRTTPKQGDDLEDRLRRELGLEGSR